jgi:RNA polymerase sigma factor (sigma-70 family)
LVEEALQNLDEEEKHLIYLKYWEGYTVREIAQETGCAVTTTYDKIRNTLKKLKKLVK